MKYFFLSNSTYKECINTSSGLIIETICYQTSLGYYTYLWDLTLNKISTFFLPDDESNLRKQARKNTTKINF